MLEIESVVYKLELSRHNKQITLPYVAGIKNKLYSMNPLLFGVVDYYNITSANVTDLKFGTKSEMLS